MVAGALAATAKKRPGHHSRARRVHLLGLGGIIATATIMANHPAGARTPTCSPSSSSPSASGHQRPPARRGHQLAGGATTPLAWVARTSPAHKGFYVDNDHVRPQIVAAGNVDQVTGVNQQHQGTYQRKFKITMIFETTLINPQAAPGKLWSVMTTWPGILTCVAPSAAGPT